VKVEPSLLSPGTSSSALDEPQVDHLVKLEESEDVEGEPNRLLKCLNKEFASIQSSVADLGCLSRIPDPTFFHPGSRIRTVSIPDPGSRILIKELMYFNPKKAKKLVSKL
jgi:hypothetical protein